MVNLGKTKPDLRTTFYLQLEPSWPRHRDPDGSSQPVGFSVARITKSRPQRPQGGTLTVKLTLQVPGEAFLPLRPAAEVVIPAHLLETNLPIVVEAVGPEGEGKSG
jgi:hypothetical protein